MITRKQATDFIDSWQFIAAVADEAGELHLCVIPIGTITRELETWWEA